MMSVLGHGLVNVSPALPCPCLAQHVCAGETLTRLLLSHGFNIGIATKNEQVDTKKGILYQHHPRSNVKKEKGKKKILI